MKILDWNKKGNVVRFYIGDDNLDYWWGDDWNDCPYESNAGLVYTKYTKGYVDVYFPFDMMVLEPKDAYSYDSGYSKEDLVKGMAPCIIIVEPKEAEESWYCEDYKYWLGNKKRSMKIYIGDPVDYLEYMGYFTAKVYLHEEEDGKEEQSSS